MKRISKEEAETILNSHYQNFVWAMKTAREDWKKCMTSFPETSPRTRASFINDHIRFHIREKYELDKSCKIREPRGSFFLTFQDKIAARFKKLKSSRPSNISTNQSTQIELQQLTLGDSLNSPTIVNVGYVPDKSWENWRYEISCLSGKNILWVVDITPEIEAEISVPIPESDVVPQRPKKQRVQKKIL
jgi:hypothetical protein